MGAKKLADTKPKQIEVSAGTTVPADAHCIGWGKSLAPEQVLRLATELNYGHICQTDGLEFDKEMRASEALLENPRALFDFPIAAIFHPQDLSLDAEAKFTLVDYKFNSSLQKREALSHCAKAMESQALPQTLIEDISSVVDEMYTNAIFNAPFIDRATSTNPGISRHDLEIKLEGEKTARLILAKDEKRIMTACVDPFGTLNLENYLNKIKATYLQGAAATMNFGPGGAGLGSYIIFNTGASLFLGVHPGRATTVACVLPLGMSNRKRALMPKHLHWIQL